MITLHDINLKLCLITIVFVLIGLPCTFGEQNGFSVDDPPICDPKCGCDGMYIYDEVKDKCVLNMPKLMKTVLVRYEQNQSEEEILSQDGMAKSIYIEGQKLFRGILISVMLFITCASICVVSACIYCCRINYSDRKLKKKIKALARKANRNYSSVKRKGSLKPITQEPKADACTVVVEDAGVFVC